MSRDFSFRIAGQLIRSEISMREVEPLTSRETEIPRIHILRGSDFASGGPTIYKDEAWIGEKMRHLHCRKQEDYSLNAEGIGKAQVSADGSRIVVDEKIPSGPLLSEFILGPALILALAAHGIFSLHASATEIGGRALVFVGDSGSGKSTLARELPKRLPRCRRIGDDILPTRICSNRLEVLPHFPQLKLPPRDQWPEGASIAVKVHGIFFLSKTQHKSAHVQALGSSEFLRYLLAHTVAARLFHDDLLSRHLQWCRRITEVAAGYRLRYPHRERAIDQTALSIQEEILDGVH